MSDLSDVSIDSIEQTLLRRAREGDAAAYGDLARLHRPAALRVATVVLGATDGADDVVQLALERAWRSLHRFDIERPFRPWLLRIVANAARNDRRARGRHAALTTRAGVAESRLTPLTPEELAVDAEERLMVLEALSSLGAADRLVIALRHFEDLTEAEMADVLGCRPGTVKSRLSRAMARLRHRYLALAAAVAVAVLLATALVVAPAREAIADWLGIGSTRVERVPEPEADAADPTGLPHVDDALVAASDDELVEALGRPLPDVDGTQLGAPAVVGVAPDGGVLFGWDQGRTTLWVQPGAGDEAPDYWREKLVRMDADVEVVEGLGDDALLIHDDHVLATTGRTFGADRVLLWIDDGLEWRLESDLDGADMRTVAQRISDTLG